jgi:hypothetical protein
MADIAVRLGKSPKRMKQVTGNKNILKKVKELKSVNKQIAIREKSLQKRFETSDKLFTKRRKIEEQLGI